MPIATAQQMKNIDRRAIREFGIPGMVLMENAATAVMLEMERHFEGLGGVRVAVVCGKGNNGGDGLALARRLRGRGVPVRVALLSPYRALSGDAGANLAILRKTDVEVREKASRAVLGDLLSWADIIVDAILGTGITTPVAGDYERAVTMINTAGRPVVSIDIPTGIHADTGAVMGHAVRADLTVTLALMKRGLVLHPGAAYAGTVRLADIGIPSEVVEREKIAVRRLERHLAQEMVVERRPDAHKGDFGHLLVIAGSPGKAGAAVMAAQSALRAGAGLVSVAAPNGIVPVIQAQSSEVMCIPAAESIEGTLGAGADAELLRTLDAMSACAIGPGLSVHRETVEVVRNLVRSLTVPAVIDADGLNALVGHLDILRKVRVPVIVTPHPGEFGRLLGTSAAAVQADRIAAATAFAEKHRVTVVLKGAGTVIATQNGSSFVNTTGNPGMATAGSGDVLTGIMGGLLAQGCTALQAACLGVHLHGLAGDLAAKASRLPGMIAGDLIANIPAAFAELVRKGL